MSMLFAIALLFSSPVPIVPAGETFTCTPTRVWDGDGPVWCAEGPRLRLAGVAAREMDGTCRSNQPCPLASAEAARDALVSLLGRPAGRSAEGHVLVDGPSLSCVSEGSAGGSRTAAWCTSPAIGDLSCALVATKTVLVWDRYWRGHRCRRTWDKLRLASSVRSCAASSIPGARRRACRAPLPHSLRARSDRLPSATPRSRSCAGLDCSSDVVACH